MRSGPGNLLTLRQFKARSISCPVMDMVDIQFVSGHVKVGISFLSLVVNTLAKKLFSTLPFSKSLIVRVPLYFNTLEIFSFGFNLVLTY